MFFKTKRKISFFYLLKITAVFCICFTAVFCLANLSFAQVNINVEQAAVSGGLSNTNAQTLFTNIIRWTLGILGAVLLVIIILAGFKWMTSGGDATKIEKAKKLLINAVIGFAIILASYILVSFIMRAVGLGVNGNGSNIINSRTDTTSGFGNGALGGGVIETHFPARDAINVPRNTMIMISFKVPVATSSVLSTDSLPSLIQNSCNTYVNNGNACGKLSDKIEIWDNNVKLTSDKFVVVLDGSGKNILIDATDNLGSDAHNTNIEVRLLQSIKTSDNKTLFIGRTSGYNWTFQVSTVVDVTPPTVKYVWPGENSSVARNAIVQATFSEPINIFSINSNTVFLNNKTITGTLKVSNEFKTVEFLSSESCSASGGETLNSCGEKVFCLPASSTINLELESAASTASPASGISDAGGNFLDGNKDGTPGDNFLHNFKTTDTIELTPPRVIAITPSNGSNNIPINTDISATFSEGISPSSLDTNSFYIYQYTPNCIDTDNKKENISINEADKCFPNYGVFVSNDSTKANIKIHGPEYLESGASTYRPRLTSKIKDTYGNCFYNALGPSRTSPSDPRQQ